MKTEIEQSIGQRFKRASAIIRSWDGPNSRISFELNLDALPWGPFESLGRKLDILVPSEASPPTSLDEGAAARALRHVEHAAARCEEFAQLGNGHEASWRDSLATWRWLRDRLTQLWMEEDVEGVPARVLAQGRAGAVPTLPHLPGAASTLEAVSDVLRAMTLDGWRAGVRGLGPDAPTREEAIQTLMGIARLIRSPAARLPDGRLAEEARTHETRPPDRRAPAPSPWPPSDEDQLSFEYAMGYDEGYQMGRRVGRALAARENRERADSDYSRSRVT